MGHSRHKLTASQVKSLPPGKYNDGAGLWLHRREDGGGQWFLRVTIHGRRREMGLGSSAEVSLREAREDAAHWRAAVRKGIDPIVQRELDRQEAERNLHCLEDVALDAFETRKSELKGDGKAGRWYSPLELHVLPKLGKVPISNITQIDIRNTLKPIWHTKSHTARKALNRLGIVFRHAAALGLTVDLQAIENAKALLGKPTHVSKHIPSMPWPDVPEFYRSLHEPTTTHLALRMLILTAARCGALRFMHLDQIEGDTWTVPAELVKGRRGLTSEMRVPLSSEAMKVLELALPFSRDGYVFPGMKRGVISDATMGKHMKSAGLASRPGGFRSTFREWAEHQPDISYEIAETSIWHTVGGKVERAYRRTDYFDQRREAMERWGEFVAGQHG